MKRTTEADEKRTTHRQRLYPAGTVVTAQAVITDKGPDGSHYIHAAPGELGVIIDCGQTMPAVDVRWRDGSVCTCLADDEVAPYTGRVSCVVD